MQKVLFLLLALVLVAGACKKSDQPDDPNSNGTLKAKIDGQQWTASLTVYGSVDGGIFQITGSDNTGKQLQLSIINYLGEGNYLIGGPAVNNNPNFGRWTGGLSPYLTYSTQVGQGEGACILEVNGNKIEGTFEFTARNTEGELVTITDGEFTVNL